MFKAFATTLLCVCFLGTKSAHAVAESSQWGSAVRNARSILQEFEVARTTGDSETLGRLIFAFQRERSLQNLVAQYSEFLKDMPRIPARDVSGALVEVIHYDPHLLATVRFNQAPASHPLLDRVVLYSPDGGRRWFVNVLDCLELEDLKRVIPGFGGSNPLD